MSQQNKTYISDRQVRENLSKSLFMRGRQCHKSLWLYKHKPALRAPVNASTQARFDMGHEIGTLAQALFPGGKNIAKATASFQQRLALSKALLAQNHSLYEATFQAEKLLVMLDILVKKGNGWHLYEVKSGQSIKKQHLEDAAIQSFVCQKIGLSLASINLIQVNPNYQKSGPLNPHDLFEIKNISDRVRGRVKNLHTEVNAMKTVLKQPSSPDIPIGPHCDSPYPCDFKEACWPTMTKTSIFQLQGMSQKEKFTHYNAGISTFEKANSLPDLSRIQQLQIACQLDQQVRIDRAAIKQYLDPLVFPITFLDCEAFQSAIPRYDNTRPYQAMPFLVSLLIQNDTKSDPTPINIVAEPDRDPRKQLKTELQIHLPKSGSIVVYNKGAEASLLKAIFEKPTDKLQAIINRLFDFLPIFEKGYFQHPDVNGRHDLKSLKQIFLPTFKTSKAKIHNGEDAHIAYASLVKSPGNPKKDALLNALVNYCQSDVETLFNIYQSLLLRKKW